MKKKGKMKKKEGKLKKGKLKMFQFSHGPIGKKLKPSAMGARLRAPVTGHDKH